MYGVTFLSTLCQAMVCILRPAFRTSVRGIHLLWAAYTLGSNRISKWLHGVGRCFGEIASVKTCLHVNDKYGSNMPMSECVEVVKN
jgi:hypothetical protein